MSGSLLDLCLYVAGSGPNSRQALANLALLCERHLPGRHRLEVVDVLQNPERAVQDGVVLTPTLVVRSASPPRILVGSLSRTDVVLEALGLP